VLSIRHKVSAVDISERFARNVVHQREATGMTQEELAFRASIHRTQISFIESGKRMPRLDTLVKLAGALEVPPSRLLEGIAWIPAVTQDGEFDISDR
jgi:transcriptional regulator with XRE-family HTH domain